MKQQQFIINLKGVNRIKQVPVPYDDEIMIQSKYIHAIRQMGDIDEITMDLNEEVFQTAREKLKEIVAHGKQLQYDVLKNMENYMQSDQFRDLFKGVEVNMIKEIINLAEYLDIQLLLNVTAAYFSTIIKDKSQFEIQKILDE